MEIVQIPILGDNYTYLLHEPHSRYTAVIDPGDAEVVVKILRHRQWSLTHIFNTHHHSDHTDGNLRLKSSFGCEIHGAHGDARRIPGMTHALRDGQSIGFGTQQIRVLAVPGHTLGHLAFYLDTVADPALFCGDTLFSLGCGRLFEGDAHMMWQSLLKLRSLPEMTQIYCAHEYTLGNAAFAMKMDPNNAELALYSERVRQMVADKRPSVPSRMADEKACNPFLRADQPAMAEALGMENNKAWQVFARLRHLKDSFT